MGVLSNHQSDQINLEQLTRSGTTRATVILTTKIPFRQHFGETLMINRQNREAEVGEATSIHSEYVNSVDIG